MLTWQEDQEYEVHELLHVSRAAKGTREESGEKWKGLLPKSSLLFPLLALPEGMSTRTWHLFHPAYWAIHQAFLSWAENSGISIAHSQPRFSLDSLKESIMWWPETMVLGVPLSGALLASFAWGEFLESRKGKGGSHRDSAGSSVSITRVKGGQGHNLVGYLQEKEDLEKPAHEAFLFDIKLKTGTQEHCVGWSCEVL